MNDLSRREFAFITMLTALLMTIFPWLRTERGSRVATALAKQLREQFNDQAILYRPFGPSEPGVATTPWDIERMVRNRPPGHITIVIDGSYCTKYEACNALPAMKYPEGTMYIMPQAFRQTRHG